MPPELLLWLAFLAPATFALVVLLVRGVRAPLVIVAAGSSAAAVVDFALAALVLARGPLVAGAGWLLAFGIFLLTYGPMLLAAKRTS